MEVHGGMHQAGTTSFAAQHDRPGHPPTESGDQVGLCANAGREILAGRPSDIEGVPLNVPARYGSGTAGY